MMPRAPHLLIPVLLLAALLHGEEPPVAAGNTIAPGYRLYPGDLVQVIVHDHPDLEMQLRIPASGVVTYPMIGDLTGVAGRTCEDVAAEVCRRLEDGYVRRAVVSITIREFGQRLAYVIGSVGAPREVALNPLAPTTAMQAIGKSGGLSDNADRGRMQVIRPDPEAAGRIIALPLPISDDPAELAKDVVLQQGDIVIVPRLDRVYVLGQVTTAGAVNLPPAHAGPLTVTKAVTLAGGFGRFARQREVQVLRAGRHVATVDARAVLSGESTDDPRLEPGDTVYVPESRL